jgi:hypothetical protein
LVPRLTNPLIPRQEAMQDENFFLQDAVMKKTKVINDMKKTVEEEEEMLSRVRREFTSRKRAFAITKKEVISHCCVCEGPHAGNQHRPHQSSDCKRLQEKKITCAYLRKALRETASQVSEHEKTVNMVHDTHSNLCRELNDMLDQSFRVLDAFNDQTG